jgi:predicted DNA-binding protein (MmcQ/YjbR family)
MNIEEYREYCLAKKGVTECFPFDNSTLVFKVMDKMFALTGLQNEVFTVNLKCDPEKALDLRANYSSIQPGWHMNKKMWNTVHFADGQLQNKLLKDLIDHSYEEVIKSLPKKKQRAFFDL